MRCWLRRCVEAAHTTLHFPSAGKFRLCPCFSFPHKGHLPLRGSHLGSKNLPRRGILGISPKSPHGGVLCRIGVTTSEKENRPTQGQHRPHGGGSPVPGYAVSQVYFQLQSGFLFAPQRFLRLRFSTAEETEQYRCDTSVTAL